MVYYAPTVFRPRAFLKRKQHSSVGYLNDLKMECRYNA
jgi:hypothetical protein